MQFLLDFPSFVRGRRWRPAAKIEEQLRKTKNGPYCFIWKLEHENARTLEYSTRLDSTQLGSRLDSRRRFSALWLSTLNSSTLDLDSQLPTPNSQRPTPDSLKLATLDSRLATCGSRLSTTLDSSRQFSTRLGNTGLSVRLTLPR